MYRVLSPDEAIAYARDEGMLELKPLMGGLDPAFARQSLDLVEREVLPALRD
jgi:hypothetical protein